MDGNPPRLEGNDGVAETDPPLDESDNVNEDDLGTPGDLALFPGTSQTLEEEAELYSTDPTYFSDPLGTSDIEAAQHGFFDSSRQTLGSSPISGSDLSPSSSFYSRSLGSASPTQHLPAVDPSAILSPEHAGRGYPPYPVLQPVKRGPGRPRKDGQSPIPRKRSGRARVFGAGRGSRSFSGERAPRARGTGRRGRPSSVHSLSYRRALQSQAAQYSPERLGRPPSLIRNIPSQRMDTLEGGDEARLLGTSLPVNLEARLSEGPSTSIEEPVEQGPTHLCAFCGCGERSLLGQGEINRYEPTPGFNPFKRVLQKLRKGSGELDEKGREKSSKPLTWRRRRGPPKEGRERSRSPRQSSLEEEGLISQTSDELSQVGFAEDVEITHVFEASGHVWAHDCCAVWSEGVSPTEDHLQFVDRAVISGLSQKCSHCRRYGATISCRGPRCQKRFHFPCASAGGCFQEMKSKSLLCNDHLDQAETLGGMESLCVQCGTTGNVAEQLFCTTCGHHYHGNCLCPPVEVKPTVRAGWQCPNCKICQTCRHPGDDCKMLVCDLCDKGYHTFCLKPAMTTIPKNGWKCKNCRMCTDCGARTPGNGPSSRWHLNYSVCDSCYQQRNKGLCCPLCGKAYRHFDNKQMVQCNSCKKYVHSDCDSSIDSTLLTRLKDTGQTDYICTVCRAQEDTDIDLLPIPPSLTTEESLEGYPSRDTDYGMKDDQYMHDTSLTAASSQESLYYEDSSSSMDVELGISEKPVSQLTSPSGLASYMQAKAEMLESHRGKLPVGRKRIGAGRPRTRPLVPEKKREKRRGPKVKIKTGQLGSIGQGSSRVETDSSKDDSGDDHPATIVLTSSKDNYVLDQDICKSCGAFGKDDEGRLISCTQCGQSYHPYCANVKVTKVILQKGWRCLDCTVCEGCGSPKDEGRLLLCDDCDISYHTYCLDPPLEHVPKGTWKCKWCVCCQHCGSTSPGFCCTWQNNYNQCGPCYSKQMCPVCRIRYREEELIIQCVQCDRWLHAFCDGIKCEDDAERAADYGYHCLYCRPKTGHPGPLPPPPPPPPPPEEKELKPLSPPMLSVLKEPEVPKQFLMDGVYLSASGIQQIQSLTVSMPKKTRQRRIGKKLDKAIDPHSKHPNVARLLSMSSIEGDDNMDKDPEESKTPEPMEGMEPPLSVAAAALEGGESEDQVKKRRQRKQTGLGVGGFIPRQRTRTWKRQTSATEITPEDGAGPSREGMEGAGLGVDGTPLPLEKVRKRRRPRAKSQLEENFPAYLQEAFFGRPLLDTCKDSKETLAGESDVEKDKSQSDSPTPGPSDKDDLNRSLRDDLGNQSLASHGTDDDIPLYEGDLKDILPPDLSDLPHDEDILNILETEDSLPIGSGSESGVDGGDASRKSLDNLDSMLDDKLDSMLTDVVVPTLTQIDPKSVEDVFSGIMQEGRPVTGVPADSQFPVSQQPIPGHPLHHLTQQMQMRQGAGPPQSSIPLPGPSHLINTSQVPPLQMPHEPSLVLPPIQSPTGPVPDPNMSQQVPGMGTYGMGHPPFGAGPPQVSPNYNAGPNPAWALGQDDDQQEPSSRRNLLKWGGDEALGLNATISAVLYANTNHPNLKTDYPDWSERSKQIAKLWKKLTPDEKAPFLSKARKNRTSSRVQKAQKQVSQELHRRQQEAQKRHDCASMPPPPPPPPLPSPGSQGTMPGDPFMMPPQPLSPHGLEGRRPDMVGMMSPRHPGMHSPGRPMEGGHPMAPVHSPLHSPHGPMPRPPWGEEAFPGAARTIADPMMGPSPGPPRPAEAAGRPPPPSDPYAFQPSTPLPSDQFPDGHRPLSHPPRTPVSQPYDPYSQPPGTPRPMLEEDPYAKMPGTPAAIPQSRPYDPYSRQPMTPHPATSTASAPPRPPGDPYAQPPGTPRPAGVMDPFHQRPRLPPPNSPGGPMGGPRPGDPTMRPRQAAPDPYAFPPGTPRPGPEEGFNMPRPGMTHGLRQQMVQQLSPRMRHPSPEHFQQQPTSQAGDPYSQQPMTPHPGMPQSPQGGQSPHSTPLRHQDQPFPGRPPQQQLQRSQSLPDPFSQQLGGPPPDVAMSRTLSQLSPGGMLPLRGPRPPFMQEKPAHPESAMLQQLYSRRHSHLAAGPWPSSLSHTLLGEGMEGGDHGMRHQHLREMLAQQILKTKMRKQQEESEKIKGPQWPPQDGVPQSLPSNQPGVPPQFGMEMGPRPPPGFTEHGPNQERWAALRQRMIRPPNPEAEGFGPRGHMEMQPGFPGQMRGPRPPLPGMPHGFPPGTDPSQDPRMGSPGHGQFPPTSMAQESRAQLLQALQEQGAASQGNIPPGQAIQHQMQVKATSAGAGFPQQAPEGVPSMALHHPGASPGQAQPGQFPGSGQKMPGPGSTQMLPPFSRQASQPGTAQSEEDLFRQTPLTSARDPMISENNLKQSGDGLDETSQSGPEHLQLSDIELKVTKQSMSSEDEKHEDDDLLNDDGTFDILKFADPELGSDEDKFLDELDLMDESNKLEETKTEQVPKTEAGAVIQTPKPEPGTGETPAAPGDEERKDKDGEDQSGDQKAIPATDFQAKFLEFSQKRQEQFAIDAARLAKDGKKDDKEKKAGGAKTGVSHIAALLQGTEPIGTRIEKSEIEKRLQAGVKIAEAGKPQTDPLGLGRVAIGPGMSPLQHGRSPMQGQHTPVHMSPSGSIGVPGQAPGTPGIPSPKFIPSPRSGQPSPRTPNVHSPFSQLPVHSPHSQPGISGGSQLSPFSTSVPSPFSPTVSSQSSFGSGLSSTPQSPFSQGAPPRPGQPGFPPNTPQGMLNQPPQTASHQQGQFPMHHPSRATMTPTNQYTQGTYGQQLNNAPPRGGTLTPTPSSILYGQSAASQHGMRMQGPVQRPLFHPTGMPGEEGPQDPNRPLGPDGQPVSQAGMPGQSPSSIGQQLQSETAAEIAKLLNQGSLQASASGPKGMGMLLERPGMPPQTSLQQQLAHGHPSLGPRGMPPGFGGPGQPRMPHPGMRMPGPRMPGFQGAGPGMMRPPPQQHKEQATLLDELLEQEKQEQKRQAEQQAMIHRREMVGKPEGMIPPGMRPGLHHKLGPRMEHPRMAGPGGEPAWSATPGGPHQGDLATSPQFQGFGPRPQGQLSPRTPSPFQATSPGMQPPRMSPLTMIPPPPQPPMPPPGGEVGPEYDRQQLQYEDWLTKQAQFLDMQIKLLEQQIAKQKRTKKSIQARQRQARKNGNELNPNDVAELERITTEQSGLQKQLEALRKQQRQHQMMVQDYRTKQKEQMGRTWLASPGSSQGMMSPQSSQVSPVSTPSSVLPPSPITTTTQASSTPPQTPPVRAPGANSVRLTRSDRQEYEAYMQNRLRMLSQQQGTQGIPLTGPRIRLPVPPGQIPGQVPPGTPAPASGGPPMPAAATPQGQGPPTPGQAGARLTTVLGDNNPFSEDFQQREQLERFREKNRAQNDGQKPAGTETAPPATPEALAAGPPQPGQPGLPGPKGPPGPTGPPAPPQQQQGLPQMQFFRERMGFEQGPRFPRAPGMFAGEGAPRPFEGPRPPAYPGTPGHPGPPGMFPQMPGSEQSRLPFPQGMHFQPGFGIPPTANLPPEMGSQGEKEKPKKRRKKKKAAETDNAQSQPLPPSIPTQAAVLGQSPAAAPTAQPVTTAPTTSTPAQPQPTPPPPKVPDFPIKPQSETERRILEILQNTAALAQKEGDEQSSAGKSPRGKSPAAAASLPATASPLPATPQPVQAPTPPGSVAQTGAVQQPASDTSAVPSVPPPGQPVSGPQVPVVSQISSQNIAVPTQVQPPMSVQQPGPLQSAREKGSESVPLESTPKAPDVQTGSASPGNSSAESNPSIPHLETQLSQSSAAAQGTYESPPHLQPQTDVGVEETASSRPTDPPVASTTVTAPSTTESQPSTSEVKEKSSEEGSTAKPSEGAYDEPDGGSTVEGGDGSEEPKKKFVCDDGIHCGTDDEEEEEEKPQSTKEPATAKFVCDDGIHCGTDDEDETPADKGSSESHPGQSTSSDQTTQGEGEEKSSSESSKPRQEETEASNVEVKTEPSETKPEEQKEKVELTKTPEVSISQSTTEPSTPTTSSSGEMSTVKAEGALSLATQSTVQPPISVQSCLPSDAPSISGQVPPVSKSDLPEVTGTVSKTEMTHTPSTPQNIVGQVLQRPPLPPGHPMFRQIHQQMMQDQMMRASQEQQTAVSKSGPEQAMSQTQRLPPSYASAIMANQTRQSPATPSTLGHAESTIPEPDQNPKQEGHDQNIPLPNSSQPSRTLVSQLMQASIASSVSLPGNMMTLSSAVPSTPASPRLSHPTATTSITFSTDSQPVQPNPQNPNQMNDPRMRMPMSAAALQQHAAYVARMQGMHRMPGMVPQRMQSHSQAMPTMTMGQRMMGHSSPSQTTSPGIPMNTSPHSAAQVHLPQHSPEGLPRSLPQTQGLPAHIQGQPPRGPGQPQHPGQEAMPRPMLHGQGMPPHVPGQPPHSAAQNPGVPSTSIQGMPPRSAAPGMPPHSMQQGMHPHFPQRGMSPQEIMQRMAQGGMPPHMLQRMPQHMQGQRMPPHGMPRGMQQMPPGMQHNMHPGMPPHNLQGMPPNSAHLHPSAHSVQSQGLPPQAHGGMPHSGMHPGMPPHSIAQGMPPHSNAQGMQPLSTAPGMPPHSTATGMPPHSTAPGMPPHSTAPGMPPHSTAPGMPPHSTALGMPPHSARAGNSPHSVGMGMPPHSIGTGMPRPGMSPHSTLPGMPPHSVPQGMPPHGAPGMPPHMMQRGPSPRAPGMPPHSTQGLPPHLSQAPTSQGQGRPTLPMPLQIPGQPMSPHSMPGSQQTSTGQALSPLHMPSKQTPPATSPLAASATPPQAPSSVTTPPHSGGTPATTPLSSSQTSPAGSLSALAALSPSDSIKIKQEPSDDVPALPVTPGTSENPDLTPEEAALQAKQNALLKRLLSNSGAKKGQLNPQGEGDDIPELTPEQQQQLEMIDKMPIFRETEISSEEWESKTPEEREKILGEYLMEMRRQEYERKRKEYEELRKAKRKTTPEAGATEVKLKRRKKTTENKDGVPKRRIRKQKGKESEIEARTESFLQQLRTLPPINLQEPPIGINNNIVPVLAANTHTADNQLRGSYAKAYIEGLPDFYGSLQHPNFPMGMRPPLGDIAARRRFLSDGQHVPFTDEQRYHLLAGGQGLPHRMPLLPGMMRPFFPALPPPPRIEPHLEPNARDTPDTIISSSSPEVGFGDTELELPALRPIDPALNEDERGTSPAVPLLHPVPIKPEIKDEKQDKKDDEPSKMDQDLSIGEKKERLSDPLQSGKETLTSKMPALTSSLARPFMDPSLDQQVSVTLTLSATAAEDIGGVISAIADLLKIAVPPTYEMTRSPSPETFKMNLTHKEEAVNIQSLIKAKPKFCRHCDVVVLSSGIRKKKTELPFLTKDDQDSEDEEVTFCSMNCYMQFTITHQMPQQSTETEGGNLVEHKSGLTPSTSPRHIPVTSALSISTTPPITPQSSKDQPATPTTPLSSSTVSKSPMPSPALPSPPVKNKEEKAGKKHRRSSSTASDVQLPQFQPMKPLIKRWKDIRYQRWDLKMLETLGRNSPVPTKEIDSIWSRLDMIIYACSVEDTRKCSLCSETCDGETDSASRLLNMDVDKWVHLNCALWSYEVYETLNGALMNVDVAFKRGATIECVICGKLGATLSCFKARCVHTYHLPCAKAVNCLFFQDKTLLCPVHAPKGPVENELESLVVYRRVYINRDEDKQVASMIHQDEGSHTLRVGSLILHSIGQLLPHQIQTGRFHSKDYIFPVGFRTSRFYWSMRQLYKRCRYTCSISDNDGRPEFTIKVIEEGFDDAIYKEPTARDAWMHVLQPIEKIRKGADLVKMFPGFITGEELFGLTEPNILKVIESLPGTDLLGNYIFRYGRSPLIEMPLAINPTGCARTEPKLRTHFKRRPHTLQSSNSRSLPTTVTGVTGDVNSPYMKQFVHSKSQQYRRLKTEWKTNVFLARSGIQGLGLFAARDLEKHTMVIEYIGDLIRNEVANRRETVYEEQNRGVYMFRIDCDTVIDATMAGGPARYINHSCAPNCVAEVVPFEKESKIIIITSRRLAKGEELTYDYKFDFEDDQHKIPCNCGANGCRKWMN